MSAVLTQADRLSPEGFMAFLEPRPDHERWELFDGFAVMQANASLPHQFIASTIARLIDDALLRQNSTWTAIAQGMVDLGPVFADNMYVPDVLVLDTKGIEPLQSFTSECIMAVEVVSPSDRRRIGRGLGRKIEVKTERYRALPRCQAVLIVEQDRMDATLHLRGEDGWSEQRVVEPDEKVVVPPVGLVCRLRDFYLRTSLVQRTS